MNGANEVTRRFFVAGGYGAVLLKPSKKVLDQVAGVVQMAVMATLMLAGVLST